MNLLLCSCIVLVVSVLSPVNFCSAGTTAYHRETNLDELKGIDSLVSTGLPLFSHGFFIATGRGPVLVKKGNNDDKTPRLNPGYYRTLPRLIPQGYEGIATSHFNLGSAAFPIQSIPLRNDEDLVTPPNDEGIASPVSSGPLQQEQQGHQGHQQNIQYQQQYFNRGSPTASPSQFTRSFDQHNQQQQQEQQQPQQSQNYQTYFQGQHQQQQLQQFQNQQPLIQPPQVQQQQQQQFPRQGSPVAQETFQIDNFLTPGEEPETPTSYQRTEFGHEQFVSHKFIRNPTVEQAVAVDETLPEGLKNPFYRNEQLASALAQESLPVPGEQVVGEWDTTKIQKSKIHELLRGAGLI